jgi:predicted glycogen debranching enzyme
MTSTAGAVTRPIRRLPFDGDAAAARPDASLEWLVTNGLGGYAAGPVRGGLTRRYHGVLVASLAAPLGRMVCLSALRTTLVTGGRDVLVDHEDVARLDGPDDARLCEFRLEAGLPVWVYAAGRARVERRVVMPACQNTTLVRFHVSSPGERTVLRLLPFMAPRAHEVSVAATPDAPFHVSVHGSLVDLTPTSDDVPSMRWLVSTPAPVVCHLDRPWSSAVEYAVERDRGYDFAGTLWTPGEIAVTIDDEATVDFAVSTEPWDVVLAAPPATVMAREVERRDHLLARAARPDDAMAAELTLAADQFIVTPVGRFREVADGRAEGEEPRTVIAGYPWFTDWGRDTMISLEGLALATGRAREAARILHTFAHHLRDGLIPNLFPEGVHQGLYHTADATLWFVHAVSRYVAVTNDRAMVSALLPAFIDIVDHHTAGTRFGIHVDPADGLLAQGADHYQLTWMDAKVGDWVVTPRRGKAVEINALWYQALCQIAAWLDDEGRHVRARTLRQAAARTGASFNQRFWNEATGHLYDVVDGEQGDDPACRPNQILAIALPHAVLDPARWSSVLDVVERTLVTPVGLRSLAPGHPDYQAKYFGDVQARDAAYHQGTVWAWLIGPFIDAWLKVHPGETTAARRWLAGFEPHLNAACVGSISEIFDAAAPFTPRGCVAQAWSVAEVLRAWIKTSGRAGSDLELTYRGNGS